MSVAQTIPLEQASAGMVLAADLCDGGKVLLPAGATLSEASLTSLRRRGIETLEVLGEEAAEDAAAAEAERARRYARLTRLFRASAEQGATGQLLARLQLYRSNG